MKKRVLYLSILILTGSVAVLSLTASFQSEPREIKLIARGMTFYLAGDPDTPNPAIEVEAGQQIRIVLENQDRGITHEFRISDLSIAISPLEGQAAAAVLFRAPQQSGSHTYYCTPHAQMMHGVFVIR
ncbi:MAG: cupredoxin domain-containing protein [Acidobacteria bacterium]|nr:cupredoxin domain-containing protein [Acidobacteriota bacterium]